MIRLIFLISAANFFWMTGAYADQGKFTPTYKDRKNNLTWGKTSWAAPVPTGYSNGCMADLGNGYKGYESSKCTFEQDIHGKNITDSEGNFLVAIKDSDAAQACRAMGARLPTKPEFESLMMDFEHLVDGNGRLRLTSKGQNDMWKAFDDDGSGLFWTSSVNPDPRYPFVSYGFNNNPGIGYVDSLDRFGGPSVPVRCVVHP